MTAIRGRAGRELATALEHQILSGRWPTCTKIPAERTLSRRHGVSRETVRVALDELERAGLVVRRHGSGTYVAARRLEQSLLGHFSIVESLRSAGAAIETRVLSKGMTTALPTVAHELGVTEGANVLELERLRSVDGVPLMLERTWLPGQLVPTLEDADLASEGLYRTLRHRFGIVLVRAVESFEPVLLRPAEARLLGEEANRPALMLLRTTYDDRDRPIETARALLRGDRCRTLVERRVHEPARP